VRPSYIYGLIKTNKACLASVNSIHDVGVERRTLKHKNLVPCKELHDLPFNIASIIIFLFFLLFEALCETKPNPIERKAISY
jgi:hypothetical protein